MMPYSNVKVHIFFKNDVIMNVPRSNDFVWYNTSSNEPPAARCQLSPLSRSRFKAVSPHLAWKRFLSGLRKSSAALALRLRREFSKVHWAKALSRLKRLIAMGLLLVLLRENVSFHVRQRPVEAALSPSQPAALTSQHVRQAAAVAIAPEWPAPQTQEHAVADKEVARDFFADHPADDAETRRAKAYIRRFRRVARIEMEKFGIPASIKMAQALVESRAGSSKLVQATNNHFGIKCFSKSCEKGHCVNFSDDHHKDFFRIYTTAWESWRAHSLLLTQGRYRRLLDYGTDYRKWASGLKALGYATDPNYAQTLIQTIETFQLWRLDN